MPRRRVSPTLVGAGGLGIPLRVCPDRLCFRVGQFESEGKFRARTLQHVCSNSRDTWTHAEGAHAEGDFNIILLNEVPFQKEADLLSSYNASSSYFGERKLGEIIITEDNLEKHLETYAQFEICTFTIP
jgi:hypothetical protein